MNLKFIYFYVRSNSGTKDKIGPLKDDTGDIVSEGKEMCEVLNMFFSYVFTNESNFMNMPEMVLIFQWNNYELATDLHE